ncbi:hypothetical protein ACFWCF_24710 [Rhodococcus sp. NPDC060090]
MCVGYGAGGDLRLGDLLLEFSDELLEVGSGELLRLDLGVA